MSISINGYNPYYYTMVLPQYLPAFQRGINREILPEAKTNYQIQPDSISFSASNKIAQNKKEMSTGMKVLLGIAGSLAAIYGSVVAHRAINKPTLEAVQKNFSEIFGRDISREETNKLLENYKSIIKNNKTDEYLNKLFEQVKKDMGYEDLDIKLIIEKLKDGSFKSFKEHNENGAAGAVNHEIIIFPRTANNCINPSLQRETFGTMFHEWKHIKQAEIAYRTSPDKLVEAYVENIKNKHPEFIEQIMKENKYSKAEALKDINLSLHKDLDVLFAKYPKFKVNSNEYKKGLEYIDCARTYTNQGKEYFEQIDEREAFDIGNKARKIYDYISNPWRIF